jgi:transcriptional regulator with XRE-family HTH domain
MAAQPIHNQQEQLGVTYLAARVGVDKSHMSLILAGKRTPSLPVAAKLAKELGISIDELYYEKLAVA